MYMEDTSKIVLDTLNDLTILLDLNEKQQDIILESLESLVEKLLPGLDYRNYN